MNENGYYLELPATPAEPQDIAKQVDAINATFAATLPKLAEYVRSLEEQLADARESVVLADQRLGDEREHVGNLLDDNDKLRRGLEVLTQERDSLKVQLDKAVTDAVAQTNRAAELQQAADGLREELQVAGMEYESQREQLNRLRVREKRLRDAMEELLGATAQFRNAEWYTTWLRGDLASGTLVMWDVGQLRKVADEARDTIEE